MWIVNYFLNIVQHVLMFSFVDSSAFEGDVIGFYAVETLLVRDL